MTTPGVVACSLIWFPHWTGSCEEERLFGVLTIPSPSTPSRPWISGYGRAEEKDLRQSGVGCLHLLASSSLQPTGRRGPCQEGQQLPPQPEGESWDSCTWEGALGGLAALRPPPGGEKGPAGVEGETGHLLTDR